MNNASGGTDSLATILVVDDDDTVRNALFELFAEEHTCHAAATAEQALTYLSSRQYDVVVTDYQMPGLTGLDVLAKVKESQQHTPVILISGSSSRERAEDLKRMGAFDYLAKPFRLQDIEMCVARAITHRAELLKKQKEASLGSSSNR
jgi:two-component system response regulator PilR (NtrC family)